MFLPVYEFLSNVLVLLNHELLQWKPTECGKIPGSAGFYESLSMRCGGGTLIIFVRSFAFSVAKVSFSFRMCIF